MMSFKIQIPSLCKQYSFRKEVPEVFLKKKDIDSQFYPKTSDISQFHQRIAFVSNYQTKNCFQSSYSCFAVSTYSSFVTSEQK